MKNIESERNVLKKRPKCAESHPNLVYKFQPLMAFGPSFKSKQTKDMNHISIYTKSSKFVSCGFDPFFVYSIENIVSATLHISVYPRTVYLLYKSRLQAVVKGPKEKERNKSLPIRTTVLLRFEAR